jgi:hypothetical protein
MMSAKLTWTGGRKLVGIADDQRRGMIRTAFASAYISRTVRQ